MDIYAKEIWSYVCTPPVLSVCTVFPTSLQPLSLCSVFIFPSFYSFVCLFWGKISLYGSDWPGVQSSFRLRDPLTSASSWVLWSRCVSPHLTYLCVCFSPFPTLLSSLPSSLPASIPLLIFLLSLCLYGDWRLNLGLALCVIRTWSTIELRSEPNANWLSSAKMN